MRFFIIDEKKPMTIRERIEKRENQIDAALDFLVNYKHEKWGEVLRVEAAMPLMKMEEPWGDEKVAPMGNMTFVIHFSNVGDPLVITNWFTLRATKEQVVEMVRDEITHHNDPPSMQ